MGATLAHDWFPQPVPDNVSLGPRTWLYSVYAFRHYRSQRPVGVKTGHDTGLYHGTFFDLGPNGEVSIGDYCAVVGAIFACDHRIEIHDYAFIAHEVVFADHFAVVPPDGRADADNAAAGQTPPRTSILIGENVWIGARAVLLDGARVGEGAIVGAAATVDF